MHCQSKYDNSIVCITTFSGGIVNYYVIDIWDKILFHKLI